MVQRNPRIGVDEFIPMEHCEILEQSGLLNLLKISHFGRAPEVNAVVKVLLSCIDGGYLWLGSRIDINVYLIHLITRLSKIGKDLETHFSGKDKDKKLPLSVVNKYKLQHGEWIK